MLAVAMLVCEMYACEMNVCGMLVNAMRVCSLNFCQLSISGQSICRRIDRKLREGEVMITKALVLLLDKIEIKQRNLRKEK
jgi:hypothetical protein